MTVDSDKLLTRINQSFFMDDAALQEAVVEESMAFYLEIEEKNHLHIFCHSDDSAKIVTFLIIVLAGFEVDFNAPQFANIRLSLDKCSKCLQKYHMARAELRNKFLLEKAVPYDAMEKTLNIPAKWEAESLLERLNKSINDKLDPEELSKTVTMILVECFLNPRLLRLNDNLKSYFHGCFNFFNPAHEMLSKECKLYPGLIYLMFEGSEIERDWALNNLYQYQTEFTSTDLSELFEEEFEVHYFNIQNPSVYSSDKAVEFWSNVVPLVKLSQKEGIKNSIFYPKTSECFKKISSFRIVPMPTLFIHHIFSFPDKPLTFLLRFLSVMLQKFELETFDLIKPHNYRSFFDMTFKNPEFAILFNKLPCSILPKKGKEADSSRNPAFIDLFEWMGKCSDILEGPDNCQFIVALFGFLINHISNSNCGTFIGIYVMNMLAKVLKLNANDSKQLENEINYKASARSVLDKKSIMIFDTLQNSELSVCASHLIYASIAYDITALSFQSLQLSSGKPVHFQWEWTTMWGLLSTKLPQLSNSQSQILFQVMKSFSASDYSIEKIWAIDILYFKTKIQSGTGINRGSANNIKLADKDLRDIIAACNAHNKIVTAFTASFASFMNRLAQHMSQSSMVALLNNKSVSKSLWSSLFCPEEKIYEATMGYLYECWDVDGRQEALAASFGVHRKNGVDPELLLQSIAEAVNGLSEVGLHVFAGVKRGVKILMDLVSVLFDPITGVIVDGGLAKNEQLILKFWKSTWNFLGMIFKSIFEWSINYEKIKATLTNKEHSNKISAELLDFTRDVLDLSTAVINGIKVINAVISYTSDSNANNMTKCLLTPILPTLWDLFKWLRLSDTALLVICVNLIKNLFDLCAQSDVKFNNEILEILIKLCMKAKRFNNKMSAEQRGELLIKARVMNCKLVEIMTQPPTPTQAVSSSPETETSIKLDSGMNYTPRSVNKQGKLSQFLKPYVKEEVIDLTVPKRLSALEEAKLKLAQRRASPVVNPAPARPEGFNKKKLDSDSESDDSDNDEGAGLFTREQVLEKMKKSKLKLQSLQGTKFSLPNPNPDTAKQQLLKQKKKEEELMRLRLNVDMTPLYLNVLKWNYNETSDLPDDKSIMEKCEKVKDQFDSPSDYLNAFEPLLLLECWQSIQRSKQLANEKPFRMTMGSRSATDKFFDVYASVKKSVLTDNRFINDNDLVVLMLIDNLPTDDETVPKNLAQNCKINCLAKVKEIKSTNNMFADITLRVSTASQSFLNKVSPQMELVGMKVITMTTIEREYSSLRGFQYYDLCKDIIRGDLGPLYKATPQKIEEIKSLYDVNDSQAQAITGTVHGDGFSLIQGPPGTGKTKTILGVIGYFLTNESIGVHQVMTPGTIQNGSAPKRKILICAPSNAAVDELVLRIKNGIKNSKGIIFNPNVVRLGKSDAINEQVRDLTLEEQVDQQLSAFSYSDDSKIREEHRKCILERDSLRNKLENTELSENEVAEYELKLQQVMSKRRDLGKKLDEAREQRAVKYRNREIERRNLQFKILNEAQVVCSTLSGSAHDVLARMSMTFDTVVIDEAAQCIELSAIIPLRYGCKKCIMVGDPNQLPPTVLSQKAAAYNYEQSLFVRMQNNHNDSIYLLNTQYRMHPDISRFPSKEFYNSKLLDGEGLANMNKRPWHSLENYSPYRFFQIEGKQKKNARTMSLFNTTEAEMCLEIVKDLFKRFQDYNWMGKIGIISPYKEQIRVLKDIFYREFGHSINSEVDFNTVDGFQGQEKEIILFSCVRAEAHQGIGFLADIRRMNVALTRARTSLWILGEIETLISNKTWKDLINDARARNLITKLHLGFTRSSDFSKKRNGEMKVTSGFLPLPKRSAKIEELETASSKKQKKQRKGELINSSNTEKSSKLKASEQNLSHKGTKNLVPPTKFASGYIPAKPVLDSRNIPTLPRNGNNNLTNKGLNNLQNNPMQLIKISKKNNKKKADRT